MTGYFRSVFPFCVKIWFAEKLWEIERKKGGRSCWALPGKKNLACIFPVQPYSIYRYRSYRLYNRSVYSFFHHHHHYSENWGRGCHGDICWSAFTSTCNCSSSLSFSLSHVLLPTLIPHFTDSRGCSSKYTKQGTVRLVWTILIKQFLKNVFVCTFNAFFVIFVLGFFF